ncbi:MAG TPA: hypothetical protein VFP11_07665 [Candidatus Angelobacter sp.]|nr:hypothetical protein [Candidatus Angelobacter sp.]
MKSPTEFGLVRVNVTVEIGGMAPPVRRGIRKGLKASLIVGGAKTATVAVEVFPNANPAGTQKQQMIRMAKEKIRVPASFNIAPTPSIPPMDKSRASQMALVSKEYADSWANRMFSTLP